MILWLGCDSPYDSRTHAQLFAFNGCSCSERVHPRSSYEDDSPRLVLKNTVRRTTSKEAPPPQTSRLSLSPRRGGGGGGGGSRQEAIAGVAARIGLGKLRSVSKPRVGE